MLIKWHHEHLCQFSYATSHPTVVIRYCILVHAYYIFIACIQYLKETPRVKFYSYKADIWAENTKFLIEMCLDLMFSKWFMWQMLNYNRPIAIFQRTEAASKNPKGATLDLQIMAVFHLKLILLDWWVWKAELNL